MGIKHRILKNGKGDTKIVDVTPLKSIRYKCVECMGFQPSLIKGCTSPDCPIYLFRFGKNPSRKKS